LWFGILFKKLDNLLTVLPYGLNLNNFFGYSFSRQSKKMAFSHEAWVKKTKKLLCVVVSTI